MSTVSIPDSLPDSITTPTETLVAVSAVSSASGSAESPVPFDSPLPILSILALWSINIVIGVIVWGLLFGRRGPPTLWDKDSKKSLYCFGQNNYLIRIRTGNCTNNYDHKSTQLKFHIIDEKKKKVGSIIIPPTWLHRYGRADPLSNLPDVKILQFNWCRAEKVSGFNFIQASHTCRIPNSSIIVYDVDVRSQKYGLALKSIVGMHVESLRDSNEEDQVVPLKSIKPDEDDIWISPARLSFCHFTVVGTFYASTVAVIALAGPSDFSRDDITESMINGVIAVPICLLMSFILIFTRSSMRKSLYPFLGTELAYFDLSWAGVWLIDAFGMTIYSFFEISHFEDSQIYQWTYASIMGQLLTTMLMVTIYMINDQLFKSDRKQIKNDTAIFGNLHKRASEKETLAELVPAKSPSQTSVQSTGPTYYDQLIKDKNINKVKSISEYGAALAQK